MPSTRFRPAALFTVAGLALGTFFFSALGGCQILSGLSDLEATGGKDAVSTTGATATLSSSASMMMPTTTVTSGSGMICDPAAASMNCIACGSNAADSLDNPPYCDQMPTTACNIQLCDAGDPMTLQTVCNGQTMPITELDTSVKSMHVVCSGSNCDGDTIDCGGHADKETEPHLHACEVTCPDGTCTGTIVDCTKAYGTCTVHCAGTGCSGLTLKCGQNTCTLDCAMGAAPNPKANVQPKMGGCNMPMPPMECATVVMP